MNFFFATVKKVKGDAQQHDFAGDVQIRVDVDQDDDKKLKDEDLRWGRCVYPVTKAQHKGLGTGGSAIIPGCRVFGFYIDSDRQIPMILGTMNTTGKYGSVEYQDENTSFPLGLDTEYKGIDKSDKYRRKNETGSKPKKEIDARKYYDPSDDKEARKRIDEENKTHEEFARSKESGEHEAYDPDKPHLGSKKEPKDPVLDIIKYLKQSGINPENKGGFKSTFPSLESLKQKMEGSVKDLLGVGFPIMEMESSMLSGGNDMLNNLSGIMKGLKEILGNNGGSGGQQDQGQNQGQGQGQDNIDILKLLENGKFVLPESNKIQDIYSSIVSNMLISKNQSDLNLLISLLENYETNETISDEDLSEISSILNKYIISYNNKISFNSLLKASYLTNLIKKLINDNNLLYKTENNKQIFEQIENYSDQIGIIFNFQNLRQYSNNPHNLLNQIDILFQEMLG